jgi:HSP20 family protein
MRLVKRNFNRPSNLFPVLFNNLFADDHYTKRALDHQRARQAAVQRWFNNSNVAVNIKELEDAFAIELAAPGYEKEDFNVAFENGRLVISGEKTKVETKTEEGEEDAAAKEHFTHKEFIYGTFERTFNLPEEGVDIDGIKASYNAGILTVNIPKKEVEDNKRNIDVQ